MIQNGEIIISTISLIYEKLKPKEKAYITGFADGLAKKDELQKIKDKGA